jgi:hypothetical protein
MNFSLRLIAAFKLIMALCQPNKMRLISYFVCLILFLNLTSAQAAHKIVLVKGSIPAKLKEKMTPEDVVYWDALIGSQDKLLENALNLVLGTTVQSKEENNLSMQAGEYYLSTTVWTEQLKSSSSAKSFKKWIAANNEPAKQLTADYALRSGKLILNQKAANGDPETIVSIDLPSSKPDYEDFIFSVKSMNTSLSEKLSGMSEKDRMRASMVRAVKLKEMELIIPEDLVLTNEIQEFSTVYKFKYTIVSTEEYHACITAAKDDKRAIMMRIPVSDGSFRFLAFDPFSGETLAQATRRPLEEFEEEYVSYLLGKLQLSEISRYIE